MFLGEKKRDSKKGLKKRKDTHTHSITILFPTLLEYVLVGLPLLSSSRSSTAATREKTKTNTTTTTTDWDNNYPPPCGLSLLFLLLFSNCHGRSRRGGRKTYSAYLSSQVRKCSHRILHRKETIGCGPVLGRFVAFRACIISAPRAHAL